mmetsp:Transcript_9103/g.22277  ORF Transcript_9103/g.22277 Transcript_9103/m.22277 type:complete len:740 (-) Transcript_9103:15-2234(-)
MYMSIKLTDSGWSPFVLTFAVVVLFRNPLLHLINEYRLYLRRRQYPHIVVCKGSSSTATSERKSNGVVVGVIIRVGIFLLKALIFMCGVMMDSFLAVITSAISDKEPRTAESPVAQLAISEKPKETTINHTQVFEPSTQRPRQHATLGKHCDLDDRVQRDQTAEYKFMVQKQSEVIFESSSEIIENNNLSMNKEQPLISSELPIEKRSNGKNGKVNKALQYSPFERRYSFQTVPSMSTAVALTQAVDTNSSLSEKMRKRRLNGGDKKGYSVAPGGDNGGTSRKKRKLNTGRMPLQGCVARRPTKGAWKTTKILHRREREEREDRLLHAMSRKKSKPTLEKAEYSPCAQTSTLAPALSTPAFKFGQATVDTSASFAASKEKDATFAPTHQLRSNGKEAPLPSKIEAATVVSERKSESALKSSAGFSFGHTSTTTEGKDGFQNKIRTPTESDAPSAVQFQHNSSIVGPNDDTDNKNIPSKQLHPKLGTAPSAASASSAPFLGAAISGSMQVQPTFSVIDPTSKVTNISSTQEETKPSFGTTQATSTRAPVVQFGSTAPSYEGNSSVALTTSTIAGSSEPSFGKKTPTASVFGSTTVPPTSFGTALAGGTANAFGSRSNHQPINASALSQQLGSEPAKSATIQMPISNTKENTNPGSFNSTFQVSASSNSFSKPQAMNGNLNPPLGMNGGFATVTGNGASAPAFGGVNTGGMMPAFSANAAPIAATGASARRMARKSRNRRR